MLLHLVLDSEGNCDLARSRAFGTAIKTERLVSLRRPVLKAIQYVLLWIMSLVHSAIANGIMAPSVLLTSAYIT